MTAALTRKQAENAGYTVDAHTYPWFGYMGPRFAPTRTVEVMTEREEELLTQLAAALAPVEMLLFCPRCLTQHIDKPTPGWTNPPHATHECAGCGLLWRPSNRNTVGIATIKPSEPQHVERIRASHPSTHKDLALCSSCKTYGRTFAGGCVNCGDPAL